MVVKNNYYFTEREQECPMSFVANGDVARLRKIRRFEDFYGFHFAEAVLEFPDYDDYELSCKILLDTISSESPSLTREEHYNRFLGHLLEKYAEGGYLRLWIADPEKEQRLGELRALIRDREQLRATFEQLFQQETER